VERKGEDKSGRKWRGGGKRGRERRKGEENRREGREVKNPPQTKSLATVLNDIAGRRCLMLLLPVFLS